MKGVGDLMLFDKKKFKFCVNCVHAAPMEEDFVLCTRRGIKRVEEHCAAFRYDPLKRTPVLPRKKDFSEVSEDDFSL